MSAFTLGQDHIDLLVTIAMRIPGFNPKYIDVPKTADMLGQRLWNENYASVNFRYAEHTPVPEYHWQPVAELQDGNALQTHHILQILQAVHCYEYQSCEHTDWSDGIAFWCMTAIRAWCERELDNRQVRKIRQYPQSTELEYDGIRDAAWEWDRDHGFGSVTTT